jgi:hypothetical protein
VKIHLGWNNWSTVVNPDADMTFNAASNRWEITVSVPGTVNQLDCVFNNGSGTWDNNGGADWHFAVIPNTNPQPPAVVGGLVATPVSSNQINLTWSAAAYATGYIVQRGGTPVGATAATSYNDTGLVAASPYCYNVIATNSLGNAAPSATVCTNTLAGPPTNLPPFLVDGSLDFAGYRVSSHGIGLFAALRGTKLYVATQSPGNSGPNDHFLFVTDALLPGASANAPWAKAGQIAVSLTKPYMATESQNAYVVWNNAGAGAQVAKSSTTNGVFEGVLDLVAAFGAVPTHIYIAAAAYATADGGALVSQSPVGSGPNLDPGEFFVIPTAALRDHNADGLFDRLDPALEFRIESFTVSGGTNRLRWAAMPGRAYQVESAPTPAGAWGNEPGGQTNAGPLQMELAIEPPVRPRLSNSSASACCPEAGRSWPVVGSWRTAQKCGAIGTKMRWRGGVPAPRVRPCHALPVPIWPGSAGTGDNPKVSHENHPLHLLPWSASGAGGRLCLAVRVACDCAIYQNLGWRRWRQQLDHRPELDRRCRSRQPAGQPEFCRRDASDAQQQLWGLQRRLPHLLQQRGGGVHAQRQSDQIL